MTAESNSTSTAAAEAREIVGLFRSLRRHLVKGSRAELARSGLTAAQVSVISLLGTQGATTLGEFSRELELSHSTVSGIVDRLQAKGLVDRRTSQNDRRYVEISLAKHIASQAPTGRRWTDRPFGGNAQNGQPRRAADHQRWPRTACRPRRYGGRIPIDIAYWIEISQQLRSPEGLLAIFLIDAWQGLIIHSARGLVQVWPRSAPQPIFHNERVARSWRTPFLPSSPISVIPNRPAMPDRRDVPDQPVVPTRPRSAREELAERTRALLLEAETAGPLRRQQLLDEVITSHLWLAEKLARQFRHRGVDDDDLVQVARTGLVEACLRFDPHQGSFVGFAEPTISGVLKRHFRDHGWTVRPPRPTQELAASIWRRWPSLVQEMGSLPVHPRSRR